MPEDELYHHALDLNQAAFVRHQFKAASYALASAMYCALELGNMAELEEVERLAHEQTQYVKHHFATCEEADEPEELILYNALVALVRTRLFLLKTRMSG